MMKFIILFFCTFSLFANAESKIYHGVVRDLTTNEPIPFVSISIENSTIGTTSNENGDYRITVPQNTVIVLSHINYKAYKLQLSEAAPFDIYLEPALFSLEEVVITTKPIKDIMLEVVKNSKAMLKKNIILDTYSRELVKINTIHTRFADAILSYHVDKNPKNSSLYIKQSRSSNLENNNQYSDIENTLLNIDYQDIIEQAYTFGTITSFLDNKYFTTSLKSMESAEKSYYVLIISPIDTTKSSYETRVVFDMEKKLIYTIEYFYGDTATYEIPEVNNIYYKYKYVSYKHALSYRGEADNYQVSTMHINGKFNIRFKDERKPFQLELGSNFIVLHTKEYSKNADLSNKFKKKALFDAGTNYTNAFWEQENIIPFTKAEETIIQKFLKNN